MLQSQEKKLNKKICVKLLFASYLGYYCNINTFICFVNLQIQGIKELNLIEQHLTSPFSSIYKKSRLILKNISLLM